MKNYGIAAAALGAVLLAGAVYAQEPPPRTRGTISAVNGDNVEIKTLRTGTITVKLASDAQFAAVTHAQVADIKPNSFIGTATVPQPDGTLKALEVTVFPESMRGTAEGHYGWDLAGATNQMTNGTVGSLAGSSGRTMNVTYKGGEKKIVVPDDVPIVDLVPGDRSLLKTGAHVVAIGPKEADGTIEGKLLLVGENGVVPPM